MPVRDRAAYMREYRARRKFSTGPRPFSGTITPTEGDAFEFGGSASEVIAQLSGKILALTEEVVHLKRELAGRSRFSPGIEDRAFERGQQSVALMDRRSRQKVIDEVLRKVNRAAKKQ